MCRHPFGDVAQRHDVTTVVVKIARHQPVRGTRAAGFAKHQQVIAADGLTQRRAEFFPVRDQLVHGARVHHRARQNMRARLGAFFQHHHRDVLAFFSSQLLETNRRGQATGTAAHHHHVVVHGLAGTELGQDVLHVHGESFRDN